ncbi:hypothetical protein PHSY_006544 [Pseudozyma hubeiensis SY62]|uniref:Uncharacterized protein n=1 Tax=Pseudozyma hubeiensis (strain SY62) TaxID=1305764 RepID=R9PCJ5_PSEHS|nr:hypothetical protein PHSY_006544 [Pseudozyma hubeiensis SY62]GAC98947.1 hypothetical protein PHSY_006544 [Pseudozyma hubeiensis SY62]
MTCSRLCCAIHAGTGRLSDKIPVMASSKLCNDGVFCKEQSLEKDRRLYADSKAQQWRLHCVVAMAYAGSDHHRYADIKAQRRRLRCVVAIEYAWRYTL